MAELRRNILKRAANFYRYTLRDILYQFHRRFHETVTLHTKQGLITMSTRDEGMARQLFFWGQYEYYSSLRAIHFLKAMKFIPENGVNMLDIGANIGVISIGLLLANEIERGIAIEPEPANFDLLKKNTMQNGLTNKLGCLQYALGDKEASLTMELSNCNPGDHRIRSKPRTNVPELQNESARQTIQVQSLPLDKVLELPEISNSNKVNPSMMWIDVQGFEGFVFAGAPKILNDGIPAVSEIWPYGILRSGMSLEQFHSIVSDIWSNYWVERRNRFIRYPIGVFDRYLDELGNNGYFENVIFTK